MATRSRRPTARVAAVTGRPMVGATAPPGAGDVDHRAVLECAADIVYTLDLEGRLTYVNARAYELLGYERAEGARFLGESFMRLLATGATAAAVGAIRKRTDAPLHRNTFRIEVRHKNGAPILLECHAGPLLRDGIMVGRVGIARVLEGLPRDDGAAPPVEGSHVLQGERMRIARGLRDAIAQIVFGVTADRDATDAFLVDVKRAARDDMARRLRFDDVDLEILRLIATGASNREIGTQVHLSAAAVKDRVRRIMDRLGTRRRTELAAHALRLGIA